MFFKSDYIQFEQTDNTVALINNKTVLPIVVLEAEHKSVKRAAGDLQVDLEKVTGKKPKHLTELPDEPSIIVGTVANKDLIDLLGVDTSDLTGKWEKFTIQTVTLPNQEKESVLILGSDNRGAIYGIYDITEKMGVSPWYWWMDVPVKKHDALYIEKGKVTKGEPSVQYRGFFLNDEGPSLMTWVRAHFPDFTHEFYEKIFELTLRLKANYHWPAMWDSTFYEDDDQNIVTADLYGVVIGTSHHEPMDRPHGDWKTHRKGEWDYALNEDYLKEFWTEGIERSKPYETIINLGMRGDGDEAMGGDSTFEEKIELMEKIIKDQRGIIQDTMDVSIDEVPQMWALYKEVKEYYDSGMDIPEDVTLLWGDDNFGNIRRLPTKKERERKGGAGIYYHFDYVGGPRSYKWVNTVPIQKTYEQMQKAYAYDARKVWIVNVGDLKPMEYQTEFFMKLAWDVEAFSPDNLEIYAKEWAEYTFGETYGKDVAKVIRDYVKFNGRLKPEILNIGEIYSWENEFEAERILAEFGETVALAEELMQTLPSELRDSFFQVAYYPAKASYTVLKLQLLLNLGKQYKLEGRVTTNIVAAEAKRLFEEDKQLTFAYNKVTANGKWDHMMDQVHIGYTYWQQPESLMMPETAILEETELKDGEWGVKVLSSSQASVYTKESMVVEVYNKGLTPIELTVAINNDWLVSSKSTVSLTHQDRITLTVDWDKVGKGDSVKGSIIIKDGNNKEETITLDVHNPETLLVDGYVPVDGKIAIEAENYSDKREVDAHTWQVIPDYGRTQSSVAITPVEFEKEYSVNDAPRLSYDIVLDKDYEATIKIITAPSLEYDPERAMRLGVSIDDDEVKVLTPGDLSQNGSRDSEDWERSVIINAHLFESDKEDLTEGKHTVHITLIDPQVIIQKLVIDLGGEKPTLLGPVPTPHANKLEEYVPYKPQEIMDYSILPGNIKSVDSKARVYVQESGFYSFSSSVLKTIDGLEVEWATNDTVYIEQGFHDLELDQDSKADLAKVLPLAINPTIRVEETIDGKELLVKTALHYYGNTSVAYDLDVTLPDSSKAASKGILKTDEQQVLTHVFNLDTTNKKETITFAVTVDGWTRSVKATI